MVDKGIDKAFDWVDPIYNNLYLSIHTKKEVKGVNDGDQFWNPLFGSELHTIKKASGDAVLRARDMIISSTKWMIDIGRVKEIDVLVVADGNRFDITITVTKIDGSIPEPYALWYDVV